MGHITTEVLAGLLAPPATPAISLYQPTHRANPDSLQDPIRFKNLLTRAGRSLAEKYPGREVDSLLKPLRDLQDDYRFWTHQEDGLAMFRTPDSFTFYQLQRPVEELVVVADSFHIKPILRLVQSADRFQVLCLDRHNFRIFEGNRDVLDEVDLADLATNIKEALGDELTEPHQTVASYAGSGRPGHGEPAMHHGHGGRKDEAKIDMERFFRHVDREVEARFSRPSGQPLLLATLPEYQAEFRRISRNPALLPEGIATDAGAMTADALRERAWKAVEPGYLARLAALTDDFGAADASGKAVSRIADGAREAAAGRIGTLLVEAGRIVPGRIEPTSGEIEAAPSLEDPAVDDLLDDIAEAVLRTKGRVVVVPPGRMPTDTGLAGVLRF